MGPLLLLVPWVVVGCATTVNDALVEAKQGGRCFEETIAPYSGPNKTIAYISIGLNPEWKVMEDGADFRPEGAAGMVTVGIGDNMLYGGKNRNAGSFSFPLVGATVEVDGRVVIKQGTLMF